MKTKTIDIQAKEWFDKVNGNSYFSARIFIDFDKQEIVLPIQYGYGNHYIEMATDKLMELKLLPAGVTSLSRYCRDDGIKLRTSIQENCLKRDVKAFGEA